MYNMLWLWYIINVFMYLFPVYLMSHFHRCYVILCRAVALVADLSKGHKRLDSRSEVKVISTHISFFLKKATHQFYHFHFKEAGWSIIQPSDLSLKFRYIFGLKKNSKYLKAYLRDFFLYKSLYEALCLKEIDVVLKWP